MKPFNERLSGDGSAEISFVSGTRKIEKQEKIKNLGTLL